MDVSKLIPQVIQAFASTVEAKDKYTCGHGLRVADYSVEIGRRAGLSISDRQTLYAAGLLHDIGKIGVPDSIINKVGKLTDEEYDIMKMHPVIGSDILSTITEMPELSIGARYHHERYDGSGYPDGLRGDDIPVLAQIIAVTDAYDAMTSNRSYRKLLSQEIVKAEIHDGLGRQFSPVYGRIMLDIISEDVYYTLHG